MKTVRMLGRALIPATLMLLAACQSMPGKKNTTAQTTTQSPQPETTLQATNNGARVAVFLADTSSHAGWTPVPIKSGSLYVNPQPVVTRGDLSDIKAGANKQGVGLLALGLNQAGQDKVLDATTRNPNKRLALVVGRTMMAAPSYTVPVTSQQLVFPVGTEANATAAAQAIAGTPDNAAAAPGGNAPDTPSGAAAPAKTQ
jgi:preprotein translocase subunit SecD